MHEKMTPPMIARQSEKTLSNAALPSNDLAALGFRER